MFQRLKQHRLIKWFSNKFCHELTFIKELIALLGKKEVVILPNYLAFLVLLSFIPILTLIFEVIYITVNKNIEFLNALSEILPSNVYTILIRLLDHNIGPVRILTISNASLLFIASQIYVAFYKSYLIIFNVKKQPHFIKERIVALINTLLLIILVIFLALLTVFSSYVYKLAGESWIQYSPPVRYFFNYANLVISITIIVSIVTFLMYSIPDIRQRVKDVFPGALFVTLGWIIVSYFFKVYVDNYANYENVYRTFTAVIVFVTWVYLICEVLIIGIVINKVSSKITRNNTRLCK